MSGWDFAQGEEIAPGRQAARLLGGGHRYEAWLAWDERLRSLVVAKLLRPGPDRASEQPGARSRPRRACWRASLTRCSCAPSSGAARRRRPHLVLEFVEGPRLSTLIRRYGVILEQALPLALNLCSVLHYLAREGVVHLDVKPRNIIMAGAPRLIDLSVARPLADLGALREPVGTDAYMAPEQCDPERLRARSGRPATSGDSARPSTRPSRAGCPIPAPSAEQAHPQLSHRGPGSRTRLPPRCGLRSSCLPRAAAGDRPTAAELGDALEPLVEALPGPAHRPLPARRAAAARAPRGSMSDSSRPRSPGASRRRP